MNRPFRKQVSLTRGERAEFQRMIGQLALEPRARQLGWVDRLEIVFWRHQLLVTLLLPLGLAVMMMALLTWWPLGLVGGAMVSLGLHACGQWIGARIERRRLRANKRGK